MKVKTTACPNTNSSDQQQQIHDWAATLAEDPLRFIAACWPDMRIYDKQKQILLSVRDNVETFVHAANKTGKTRVAALIAIWFLTTRKPARVVISSASEAQLESILWAEINYLIQTSELPFPLVINHLSIKKRRSADSSEVEPRDYLVGHVTAKTESFQGHHLPSDKPRVLVIFDEASGVGDEFFDAACSWAHRKLVIGNPLSTTNFFFNFCKRGDAEDPAGGAGLLRRVIHVDGKDSPNVQMGIRWKNAGKSGPPPIVIDGLLTYQEFVRGEQSYDEVQRTTRLRGQFYEGAEAMMFPGDWLDAAMDKDRWIEIQRSERRVEAVGVDVAFGGRDRTCWTLVDDCGVIQQIVLDLSNSMEIVGRTIQLLQEHQLPSHRVAIDAGGGGKQIADRLSEQGYSVLV